MTDGVPQVRQNLTFWHDNTPSAKQLQKELEDCGLYTVRVISTGAFNPTAAVGKEYYTGNQQIREAFLPKPAEAVKPQ